MAKTKTPLTSEQIYKQNKKRAKIFDILAPVVWYVFLVFTVIFFCLMVSNSVGNITEILNLLNKDIYSGEEIEANYALLVEKWGEWEIAGGENSMFRVRYIDIGNALFSGLMMIFVSLTATSFVIAVLFGKIIFPLLAKMYRDSNEEMVDMATLKSANQIDTIVKSRKEWF